MPYRVALEKLVFDRFGRPIVRRRAPVPDTNSLIDASRFLVRVGSTDEPSEPFDSRRPT
ncbi:hypothetical protein AArcMg_2452 [Natrarchaeobaculum sulfurireducens]|uniref:Uncharacterized protein n=1 Tax=Natrarchaeobaculum sulfurireducens TaxID=2044521 RepID=A0A346PSE9_9EURY|nr:hypothetical protein AArc1_1238 [Natrarchaeobaculum sulfurireducens]AXR82444.1 hypothetical protein AArcMg_2452 [Natrarchaeobaculum sulfurireducens]